MEGKGWDGNGMGRDETSDVFYVGKYVEMR